MAPSLFSGSGLLLALLFSGCNPVSEPGLDRVFSYPEVILEDAFTGLQIHGRSVTLSGKGCYLFGEWLPGNSPEADLRLLLAPRGPAPSEGSLQIETYPGTQVSGKKFLGAEGFELPFELETAVLNEVRLLQEIDKSSMSLPEELVYKIRNDRYAVLFIDLQIVRADPLLLKRKSPQ